MRPLPILRSALALAGLLACAHPARALAARAAAAPAPAVLAIAPADVPDAALTARLSGTIVVRAHVSRSGLVDSAVAVSGDPRLRASAVASVRWWIFAAPSRATWTSVSVAIDGRDGADPLRPDVLALARDAERRGATWEAVDAWTGALKRVGTNPRLRNEWTLRERAIRLARRTPERFHVPGPLMAQCQNARGSQARSLARTDHEEYVGAFDEALRACPWWADGYQWRAASLLYCGRGVEAMRDLAMFRLAAADSAARGLAQRAIATLASGDSLSAARLLVSEGQQFNLDKDADH